LVPNKVNQSDTMVTLLMHLIKVMTKVTGWRGKKLRQQVRIMLYNILYMCVHTCLMKINSFIKSVFQPWTQSFVFLRIHSLAVSCVFFFLTRKQKTSITSQSKLYPKYYYLTLKEGNNHFYQTFKEMHFFYLI
jgi:hypothetical protein